MEPSRKNAKIEITMTEKNGQRRYQIKDYGIGTEYGVVETTSIDDVTAIVGNDLKNRLHDDEQADVICMKYCKQCNRYWKTEGTHLRYYPVTSYYFQLYVDLNCPDCLNKEKTL